MTRLSQKFRSTEAYHKELERITRRWDATPSATGTLVVSKEDLPDGYKRSPYNQPKGR